LRNEDLIKHMEQLENGSLVGH